MSVSKNRGGPPKSSILIGFSIIFTIHFGVPLFLETSIYIYIQIQIAWHLSGHLLDIYSTKFWYTVPVSVIFFQTVFGGSGSDFDDFVFYSQVPSLLPQMPLEVLWVTSTPAWILAKYKEVGKTGTGEQSNCKVLQSNCKVLQSNCKVLQSNCKVNCSRCGQLMKLP